MPVYEYECTQCNYKTEELQKVLNGNRDKMCPICSKKMKKIMSKNTFHLKGKGWYNTDYKGSEK